MSSSPCGCASRRCPTGRRSAPTRPAATRFSAAPRSNASRGQANCAIASSAARSLSCWIFDRSGSPAVQYAVDVVADAVAGVLAVDAGHEQLVVVSVLVPDRRHDREEYRLLVQCAPGGRPAHPAAAAHAGVPGDGFGARSGAAGELLADALVETGSELDVFGGAADAVALAAAFADVLVGEALLLGLLERGLLDEDALPL